MALVEHLKGMSLTSSAQRELKSLMSALILLGKEETARQLQNAGDNFELVQRAAVKLSEDTVTSDKINENSQTLEHYVKLLRAQPRPENLSWQIRLLLPPSQVIQVIMSRLGPLGCRKPHFNYRNFFTLLP